MLICDRQVMAPTRIDAEGGVVAPLKRLDETDALNRGPKVGFVFFPPGVRQKNPKVTDNSITES